MQMQLRDDEKPYLEFHAGRPVRKVSPRTKHALVQGALLVILRRCAGSAYRVGTEWDCDLSDVLGSHRSAARLSALRARSCREGTLAERPSQRPRMEAARLSRCGSRSRTKDGSRNFRDADGFAHEAAPWLQSDLAEAFADLL